MRVDLHIDRLVLHGFQESDGPEIADGLRERLTELIQSQPPHWTRAGRIDAGTFQPSGSGDHVGASIATSVHQALFEGGNS
jgi:hypothetical protein